LKAKQKTNFNAATATTTVDLFGADAVQTPAKITWKFPKPFGIAGVAVDKLEMDKAGKFKFEASADKGLHKVPDLKVEAKSDLVDPKKLTSGVTYTGIKGLQIKCETKPFSPKDFVLEATKSIEKATFGFKCGLANLTKPDLGVRVESGPFFGALLAKDKLSVLTAHACLRPRDDLKVACCYEHGGKKSGSFGLGLTYNVVKGTTVKAKVVQDGSISAGVKHDITKGFTVLTGLKYEPKTGKHSLGLQLSIE